MVPRSISIFIPLIFPLFSLHLFFCFLIFLEIVYVIDNQTKHPRSVSPSPLFLMMASAFPNHDHQQQYDYRQPPLQQPQPQGPPHQYSRLAALSNASNTAVNPVIHPAVNPTSMPDHTQQQTMLLPNADPAIVEDNRRTLEYIAQLLNYSTRESALLELSKKREQVPELALVLWHTFGVMTSLLEEIILVYPLLNPSQLTAAASNRVCNALALLQCVASHNDTRGLFLTAHIPLFLYPFLNTTSKSRPFEYLRLTSLGVIGALVKNDSSEVINFLLTTEIIPLCLRIMETGSELSKTVAIFIVQKILLDDIGLAYICHTYERFYAVGTVLSNMVNQLIDLQTVRLLKHVVRCFYRYVIIPSNICIKSFPLTNLSYLMQTNIQPSCP